jgi:hypothetical protein
LIRTSFTVLETSTMDTRGRSKRRILAVVQLGIDPAPGLAIDRGLHLARDPVLAIVAFDHHPYPHRVATLRHDLEHHFSGGFRRAAELKSPFVGFGGEHRSTGAHGDQQNGTGT